METQNKNHPDRIRRRKRKWKVIIIVLGALLCIRIALPFVILHYANKKLASLDGYYGHVEDVDLWLYRGAYVVKDVYINKVDSEGDTTEFFSCPHVDLSVEWQAVWQKKLVGEVIFETPVVNYVMGENIGKEAEKDSVSFIQLIKDFMPLRINRFEVNEGEIHYKDMRKTPQVDLPMTHVNIVGTGLTNEQDTALLPATIKMDAALFNGHFTVNTKLAPLNDVPTFDLNATLTHTDLTKFNDFFKAYANCDVEQGSMSLYTEIAAKDGKFAGYAKPLIKDLKVLDLDEDNENPPQLVWEAIVGGVTEVLTNQPQDQFATKVPLSGEFSNPDIGVIEAIATMLQNAFIRAMQPALDNTISIGNVHAEQEEKGFIERIFDKDGKENKDGNKEGEKKRRKKKER